MGWSGVPQLSGSGGLTVQFDTGGDGGGAPPYLGAGAGVPTGPCAYASGVRAISAVASRMLRIFGSFGCGPTRPNTSERSSIVSFTTFWPPQRRSGLTGPDSLCELSWTTLFSVTGG